MDRRGHLPEDGRRLAASHPGPARLELYLPRSIESSSDEDLEIIVHTSHPVVSNMVRIAVHRAVCEVDVELRTCA